MSDLDQTWLAVAQVDQTWLAVAQVYATLSAGWRVAQATVTANADFVAKPILKEKADGYERLAEAALRAAGVQG